MIKIVSITSKKIKRYYKLFGYISLVFSILVFIFSVESFEERLSEAIAINIGYHMFYHFFRLPINFEGKGIFAFEKIGRPMMKVFSVIGISAAFGLAISIVISILVLREYEGFWMIFIPIGMFLGSYSLWISYKKIK